MGRWLVVIALLVPAYVQAQPARTGASAETLFQRGKQLMAAGKTAEACAAFEESHRVEPAITTLLNHANCREQNGQLATAWRLFSEAAQPAAGADENIKQLQSVASERAAKLEPNLSTLRIVVPAGNRIAGLELQRDGVVVDPQSWNQTESIDGGSYEIRATAPGHARWSYKVEISNARDAQRVEIPKLEPVGAGGAIEAAPAGMWSTRRMIAVGFGGAAVITALVGVGLGVSSQNQYDEARAMCPDREIACVDAVVANDLIDSAQGRARAANISFGIAAGAVVVGAVLWLTGAPERQPRVTATASFTSNGGGLALIGAF